MASIIARFNKTPLERKEIKFDYSSWLCEGEKLRTFGTKVTPWKTDEVDPSPLSIDSVMVIGDASTIMLVSGGTTGFQYSVRLLVSTTETQVKEDGILVNITRGVSA